MENDKTHAGKTVRIMYKDGLHMRPAQKINERAQEFKADIFLSVDDKRANAKEIFALLQLCGYPGSSIHVEADGEDAEEAVNTLAEMLTNANIE
jgi:phosphotransferase system HPr (HPr) family protein